MKNLKPCPTCAGICDSIQPDSCELCRLEAEAFELRARIEDDRRLLAELEETQRKAHLQSFGPAPTPQSIPAGLVLGRASW